MKIKEAIEWLNTDDFHSKGFEEATGIAIKALKKQIPTKPLSVDGYSAKAGRKNAPMSGT